MVVEEIADAIIYVLTHYLRLVETNQVNEQAYQMTMLAVRQLSEVYNIMNLIFAGMTGLDMTEDVIDNGSFIITSEHGAVPVFGHEAKVASIEQLSSIRNTSGLLPSELTERCTGTPSAMRKWIRLHLLCKFSIVAQRRLLQLSEESDWDGNTFQETWSVRALLRGREYALIRNDWVRKMGASTLYKPQFIDLNTCLPPVQLRRRNGEPISNCVVKE